MMKDQIKPDQFYNEISGFYDEMINFDSSLIKRKELLSKILPQEKGKAADLGCGSGLDSIALSMNDYEVTGFDISENMIKKAKENSEKSGYKLEFVKSSLDKINRKYFGKYDAAFSLGNTLANLDAMQIEKAIGNFFLLLKPGGKLVIQILNYSRILSSRERIVNISVKGDKAYIRFYDFQGSTMNFNVLQFSINNPSQRKFITSKIYPYSKPTLNKLLKDAGFRNVKTYGNLAMEQYSPHSSTDLVITALK